MLSVAGAFFGVLGLSTLCSFAPLLSSCLFSSEYRDADERISCFLQPVAVGADDFPGTDPCGSGAGLFWRRYCPAGTPAAGAAGRARTPPDASRPAVPPLGRWLSGPPDFHRDRNRQLHSVSHVLGWEKSQLQRRQLFPKPSLVLSNVPVKIPVLCSELAKVTLNFIFYKSFNRVQLCSEQYFLDRKSVV